MTLTPHKAVTIPKIIHDV